MAVIIFFIFCLFLIFVFNKKTDSIKQQVITLDSFAFLGQDKILELPENTQKKIFSCNGILYSVMKNNIKYVPNEVLSIQHIKDMICVYFYYYSYTLYDMSKLSDREKHLAFFSALMPFFIKGTSQQVFDRDFYLEKFDLSILNDKRFCFFQRTIPLFIEQEIEGQTDLLVAIEQYMEKTTGKRVRYMEQKKKLNKPKTKRSPKKKDK